MAGGNVVGVQGNGALEKERELDLIVAGKAGVRSASTGVFVTEIVDDELLELTLEVHQVMGGRR